MKKLLVTAAAMSLTACVQKDDSAGIAKAIPTAEQVSIKLPTGQARTIGELAEWYVATRGITQTFNGGTAWVLILLHTIVAFPATSVDGDTYTWGPFTDALNPAEYKLDVVDVGDGTYTYKLSGRNKSGGGDFEVIIDGIADPRAGELAGNGKFSLDFDASRRVNPIDSDPDARGQVAVTYDLAQHHLDLDIATTDDAGKPVFANYEYDEGADGSGSMLFEITGDMGGGPSLEVASVHSRWLVDGEGRADVGIYDGDAGAGALGSQCWDQTFKSNFEAVIAGNADAFGFAAAGSEADCAFKTAEHPEH